MATGIVISYAATHGLGFYKIQSNIRFISWVSHVHEKLVSVNKRKVQHFFHNVWSVLVGVICLITAFIIFVCRQISQRVLFVGHIQRSDSLTSASEECIFRMLFYCSGSITFGAISILPMFYFVQIIITIAVFQLYSGIAYHRNFYPLSAFAYPFS